MLSTERGIQPRPLQRLRDSHHTLARLVAQGHRGHEISLMTGVTESRISVLKSDPAFAELVDFYRNNAVQESADLAVRLAQMALDATQALHEKILDGENLDADTLMNVIKLTSDRIGHGPKSTQNVNVTLDMSERLAAARRRLVQVSESSVPALAPEGPIIDNPRQATPQALPALLSKGEEDDS